MQRKVVNKPGYDPSSILLMGPVEVVRSIYIPQLLVLVHVNDVLEPAGKFVIVAFELYQVGTPVAEPTMPNRT